MRSSQLGRFSPGLDQWVLPPSTLTTDVTEVTAIGPLGIECLDSGDDPRK